jgi:hypothetical protein
MVLVDTSVWIRFRTGREPYATELDSLLERDEVAGHELVFGELRIGDKGGRRKLLDAYEQMHQATPVPHGDVVPSYGSAVCMVKGPDGLMSTCWPRLSSVDTASGPRILDLPLSRRSSTSRTRSRQPTKPSNTIAQSSIWRRSLAVLDCLRLLSRILDYTANGRLRGVRKLLGRLTTEVTETTEEKTEIETILKKSEPLSPLCELCALCGE